MDKRKKNSRTAIKLAVLAWILLVYIIYYYTKIKELIGYTVP